MPVEASLLGVQGSHAGQRLAVGSEPVEFGRGEENDIVLTSGGASRAHALVRRDGDGFVVEDRGSRNGTWVNGAQVAGSQRLQPADEITMGEDVFRFESSVDETVLFTTAPPNGVLRVIVSGGGPVGLGFALSLEALLGDRVDITVYEGRWATAGGRVEWKTPEQGNVRRQQVVTIQSRQYLRLPVEAQQRLFVDGAYSQMWPEGPDSVEGFGPRNIRISRVEDELLALANDKRHIHLVTENFDPAAMRDEIARRHVLAICEGSRSGTRDYFADRFGPGDPLAYSHEGAPVQDMVLGLRVTSQLSDPMAVVLTVAQNRFLLNSLRGDGFLNMRLTDLETQEACGIDPDRRVFTPCIQSEPCVLELQGDREFYCAGHKAMFLPALLKDSPLWARVQEGLALFGVPAKNLTAVTGFRLDMTHRSRFTVELYPKTAATPGTYGFLLGDAANAIHFWPGRGLNSGLASVQSLARCLAMGWKGRGLRDADFMRHEAVMAMLQYRHKSRAWRQMVTTDTAHTVRPIKDLIAVGIAEAAQGTYDADADLDQFTQRLCKIRDRLQSRIDGLPDDTALRAHMSSMPAGLVHTLVISEPWDTGNVGGEEVDIEWLLKSETEATLPGPN